MKTSERFANAIGALMAAFGQEGTLAVMQGYSLGLGDLSIEDVEKAVAIAIRSETSVPRPARLRELILGSTEALAGAAWADASKAVGLGPYKHVDFSDRRINATIRRLGGWPTFCSRFSSAEAEKWLRIEFTKAYAQLERFGQEAGAALPGLNELEYRGSRVCPAQPRRITCTAVRDVQRIAQPAAKQEEQPRLF